MKALTEAQAAQLRAACANLLVILVTLPSFFPHASAFVDALEETTAMRDIRRILEETEK